MDMFMNRTEKAGHVALIKPDNSKLDIVIMQIEIKL